MICGVKIFQDELSLIDSSVVIGVLLFKYIQKKAKYQWNLSNLVNFIRLNVFVKIDLWKWVNDPFFLGKPPDKIVP